MMMEGMHEGCRGRREMDGSSGGNEVRLRGHKDTHTHFYAWQEKKQDMKRKEANDSLFSVS